ncbi:branched-chain amino acid ABC transporter permease [Fretibacterium sp. OH1220_COT-178]|uniref:branched-chain amino acid ABC transporter permease n=1 Tax=Fretibacterium sp. OH1220_COT-178 TaxID=2491047 RepID=UPI000F5F94FC|nr:branched-chain amino acid ABC transporter permease [Fretibacterium sp. OH1220_COT-178]RRD63416.1 branched-chain amino acid ABC transporter permease [Fretibacterium sp. OH1220_COT-178]
MPLNFALSTLFQQIINGLSLGSVYALIAVGYSLVYSILLFSNFAHGGFLVVGGYACYYLLTQSGYGIVLASAGAVLASGVVAVLTERLAYKPIRERTSTTLYLLIASMGVSIVIENIFVIVVGGRFRALPQDTFPSGVFSLGSGVTVNASDILSLAVAVIFLGALQLFLSRTRWGLAIRAAACDLRTAGLMGVNVSLLIGIVFFVAGLLAAVGGIFLSAKYSIYPQLGNITIKAFIAAVIGGLGSLPGAVLGSLLLGLAEMLTAGFISSQMRDIVVFSMLVAMLLVRPAGFFGKRVGDKI